jgi:hypothetical protein
MCEQITVLRENMDDDYTVARVIVQQYSSATLVSMRSHYRREKFRDAFKDVI